jgi:hypothetical protein
MLVQTEAFPAVAILEATGPPGRPTKTKLTAVTCLQQRVCTVTGKRKGASPLRS